MRLSLLQSCAATAVMLLATSGLIGCGGNNPTGTQTAGQPHSFPDTLRVATLWSPESYFIYRGQEMGYDYELVTAMAADKGISVKLEVAPSLSRAVEMLDSGLVDLIAYEVPITAEYKEKVIACGPENITTQVLVQPRKGETELIRDVTDLVGKDVYVEAESKYEANQQSQRRTRRRNQSASRRPRHNDNRRPHSDGERRDHSSYHR